MSQYITRSCDPFVIALLMLAMRQSSSLVIHGKVSPSLLQNLAEFQVAWNCWKPKVYQQIEIVADLEQESLSDRFPERAIVAFSGGVDSCFTLFRHRMGRCGRLKRSVEAGLMVHGFDIPLDQPEIFDSAAQKSQTMLANLGVELIRVATNFRQLPLDWEDAHGCAIVSCFMFLNHRYNIGLIASSDLYNTLVLPWGTNPITDSLLSNNSLKIIHDGAGVDRLAKLQEINNWPEGINNLRVCWQGSRLDRNCGRCEKCIRTILGLRCLGIALPPSFEQDANEEQIRSLKDLTSLQILDLETIVKAAKARNISDSWVKTLDNCVKLNQARTRWNNTLLGGKFLLRELRSQLKWHYNKNYDSLFEVKLMSFSDPLSIKNQLHKALGKIDTFDECVLLDYPSHLNIGDHLIWLGTILYLTDVLKAKINFATSIQNFSKSTLDRKVGKAPILLHGGGNIGDIWSGHQDFREYIINTYQSQPIVIMPQSIYFANDYNLLKTAKVFNSHPNLIIFVRDNYSYQLATQHFQNCQVIKAPDMAFQMVDLPAFSFLSLNIKRKNSILYQCREDKELNKKYKPEIINLPNLIVEDWPTYQWLYKSMVKDSPALYWKIPGMVRIFREGWQRGLSNPIACISRPIWQNLHPYTQKFAQIDSPSLHYHSWDLMLTGIYQFNQYDRIITNRLHGHILCTLLKIPHVFLPNSYHKNQAFYETWSNQLPFCKFIQDVSEIKAALQELETTSNH